MAIVSATHWVFAITYYQAILYLPVITTSELQDQKSLIAAIRKKLWIANGFFYALLFLTIVVYETIESHSAVALSIIIAPMTSACLLLIYTACLFLKYKGDSIYSDFFANERLMIVHTIVFTFQTIIIVLREFMNYFEYLYASQNDNKKLCKLIKQYYLPIKTLSQVAVIFTLILFIYMTSEFSRPMTQYWQKFLLVYQSGGLMGAARVNKQL